MRWLLLGIALLFCLLVVAQTGCVSPETAAKLEEAKRAVAEAEAKVRSIAEQIKQVRADYESGKLKANDVTVQLALLGAEMKAALQEGKEAGDAVKAYATAPEPWWDKAGYVVLSMLGVIFGRKLGIPGLASGTQPLPMLARKDE